MNPNRCLICKVNNAISEFHKPIHCPFMKNLCIKCCGSKHDSLTACRNLKIPGLKNICRFCFLPGKHLTVSFHTVDPLSFNQGFADFGNHKCGTRNENQGRLFSHETLIYCFNNKEKLIGYKNQTFHSLNNFSAFYQWLGKNDKGTLANSLDILEYLIKL